MATARMKAQKRLIVFVRIVAFLERTGNAIGRLVLIWATVVVGFSKKLHHHFGFLAAIIVLESFRAFSRESKSDDQLLFKTTGSIKVKRVSLRIGYLYYVNAMIITVFLFGVIVSSFGFVRSKISSISAAAKEALGYNIPVVSDYNPVLLSVLVLLSKATKRILPKFIKKTSSPESSRWYKFSPPFILMVAALRRTFGFVGFGTSVVTLLPILSWLILHNLADVQMQTACPWMPQYLSPVLVLIIAGALLWMFQQVAILTMVAPFVLGNFQIPLSITRIELGFSLFLGGKYDDLDDPNSGTHVVQSLKALYIMLICQGILYILACLFESFSFFFRASLALRCRLNDKMGMKSIGLYYEHAYTTFVQESLLDTKKMSIVTFAVDSLNSDVTPDKKLAAVKILNSFLKQDEEASNREVISQVTASTKALTNLISMLGWTVPEGAAPTEEKEVVKDADVRLFAAKVIADLAPYLRIVGIPGTMQMVSSLLDAENKPAREDSSAQIVEGDGGTVGVEMRDGSIPPQVEGNRGTAETEGNGGTGEQGIEISLHRGNTDNQPPVQDSSAQAGDLERGNTDNQPPVQDSSAQAAGDSKDTCWQHYMKNIWSIPRDSLKDEDSIPVLGVLILERLAHDVDNCVEISSSTQILPKIIGFISHITDTTTVQQKHIVTSSLTLVAKLASIKGKIGITVREYLYENLLLLSKLAEILEDSCSGPEQWKPTMDIIAKLAMDEKARQEIGGTQMIIAKLIRTFLGRDGLPNTRNDPSLRKAAGEALAMLLMDNAGNCSARLNEPGYELTKNLTDMLLIRDPDGEYVYLAAILLKSMCSHSGRHLRHDQEPNQRISSALPMVLVRIIKPDSEGKQLEALIGLATQICTLFPGSITNPPIPLPDDGVLAKKLVDELKANKRPSTEIPNMRRSLVELAKIMVTLRPMYAEAFRNHGMIEALTIVANTPSKVERYRLFSGGVGLFPQPKRCPKLSGLVAEAKWLITSQAAQ